MSDQTPNLLIITPSFRPELGGVETRLNDLCDYLKKHAFRTWVLTYQPIISGGRGLALEHDGSVEIRRYRWLGGDWFHRLLKYPALEVLYLVPGLLFWSVLFMLRRHREVDTIHTLGLNCAIIGRCLKCLFGKRWIVSTHAIYDFVPGSTVARVARWVLKGADQVLALSDRSRSELLAIGLDPARVDVHVTWVNQDRFRPGDPAVARHQLGLPDRFTVLYVGRLLKIKGADVLVRIALRHPEMTFVLAGHGEQEPHLRHIANGYANIFFFGRVENEQLPPYYQAADVSVMPSQYSEGFGRVVIESLSCGVPVVASDLGGIKDHVTSDVAILVNPTESNLESALTGLNADIPRLSRMKNACRQFAVEHFSEANAEQLRTTYSAARPRTGEKGINA